MACGGGTLPFSGPARLRVREPALHGSSYGKRYRHGAGYSEFIETIQQEKNWYKGVFPCTE